MLHPFRFGVQLATLPPGDWAERLQRIEAWGYDSVFWPDHFGPQWEPVAALAAAAAVTRRLKVGSLVYGIDYRHPIVLAKAAATIQLVSGGRHEFGSARAGWVGLREACSPTSARACASRGSRSSAHHPRRREPAKTSFAGKHYKITDARPRCCRAPCRPI